ncbi:LexA family protein [Staphylococcus caeli]|uniref:LexA family protein n=1 Tax=Staphylococcus caeli TaxID=2201815 RepID=UPI003F57EFC3
MRNNDEIIKLVNQLMDQRDLSTSELARRLDIAKSSVSRYLNKTSQFPLNKVNDFAKVLKVSPEYLLGVGEHSQIETLPVKKIPVVSQISAGLPIYSEENLIDYIYFSKEKLNDGKEEFGLKVSGDSMNKIFDEGDVVVIEKDSIVENGQLGVVMINGYNGTVKRIRYNGDQIILIPESNNPNHYPQVYGKNDEVKIVGRVVASVKTFD